jgi:endonuclease YncB( thermonuclease family)
MWKEKESKSEKKKELGQEAKTWVKSIKENEVTVEIRSIRKMHFDQKKK